jgi:maltooligosyltrehalose trehalohydrolase
MKALTERSMPIGAEPLDDGGVEFRVWAPRREGVEVVLEGGPGAGTTVALEPEANGYFSAVVPSAADGTLYRFRLDEADLVPDVAARFQPEGPHGPSQVVDPRNREWTDGDWTGPDLSRPVIYEMHVGTFTREGTWRAAMRRLTHLGDLGVNIIEIMPIADFPGRFGWGYDGVCLYAPTRLYGGPADLSAFIDRAHSLGIGVILDVVYNHFGPDGAYHSLYSDAYFSSTHITEWGAALNFDGPDSAPVREFVTENAAYWIREYHFDGLRADATQSIFDDSTPHILTDVAAGARAAAGDRRIFIAAENEPQHAQLVRPVEEGGYGLDALWNDDFHHSARVAATGRTEAYFSDYRGTPQELISALRWGYLYQGQFYEWQEQRRGRAALDLQPRHFIHYLQNHDQVANSGSGHRLSQLTSPAQLRALTALLLLGGASPLLFQGQEFAASAPFLYFADHNPELAARVRAGRKEFLAQFPSLATADAQRELDPPDDPATFEHCKLNWAELDKHEPVYRMHRDLIALSRADLTLSRRERERVQGAVLTTDSFLLRVFGDNADDRLLIFNLGRQISYSPAPEPLLAPPDGCVWQLLWSSEDVCYGGAGTPAVETEHGWDLPAHSALIMSPVSSRSRV